MSRGIDGCSGGWFGIEITEDGHPWRLGLFPDIAAVEAVWGNSDSIWIDIPIGLRDEGPERNCDLGARRLLGIRRSSVFPVPCRPAVYTPNYEAACDINEQHTGRRLSKQTWAIVPRIRELDDYLLNNESMRRKIREIHPELCFWGLAGGHPMNHNKKTPEGILERRQVLTEVFPYTEQVIAEARANPAFRRRVAMDDILDALAAAVAGLGIGPELSSIPVIPEFDAHNLPMEMVFRRVH